MPAGFFLSALSKSKSLMPDELPQRRRRWRFYRTANSSEPAKDFIFLEQ